MKVIIHVEEEFQCKGIIHGKKTKKAGKSIATFARMDFTTYLIDKGYFTTIFLDAPLLYFTT